jgi:putative FmdB family regulatory protein
VPLYEYQCPKDGRFEVIRKFSDPPLTVCPTCGSEIQKLASAPAFHLKGTGWYVTDYAKKSSGDTKSGDSKSGDSKSGDAKSESKSGESKSDAKGSKDTAAATPAATSKKSD